MCEGFASWTIDIDVEKLKLGCIIAGLSLSGLVITILILCKCCRVCGDLRRNIRDPNSAEDDIELGQM